MRYLFLYPPHSVPKFGHKSCLLHISSFQVAASPEAVSPLPTQTDQGSSPSVESRSLTSPLASNKRVDTRGGNCYEVDLLEVIPDSGISSVPGSSSSGSTSESLASPMTSSAPMSSARRESSSAPSHLVEK